MQDFTLDVLLGGKGGGGGGALWRNRLLNAIKKLVFDKFVASSKLSNVK